MAAVEKQEFQEMIQKLSSSGKAIIVEGKKDRKALEALGLQNRIFILGRPLYVVAEDVATTTKDVVILTDLDRKGKELYGKLNTQLQRLGVTVDNKFRTFLFKKTKFRQIEGLRCNIFEGVL
ncbi:MAG: toprim domain-containing protein [Candidatus Woesearchaeota archaeon]